MTLTPWIVTAIPLLHPFFFLFVFVLSFPFDSLSTSSLLFRSTLIFCSSLPHYASFPSVLHSCPPFVWPPIVLSAPTQRLIPATETITDNFWWYRLQRRPEWGGPCWVCVTWWNSGGLQVRFSPTANTLFGCLFHDLAFVFRHTWSLLVLSGLIFSAYCFSELGKHPKARLSALLFKTIQSQPPRKALLANINNAVKPYALLFPLSCSLIYGCWVLTALSCSLPPSHKDVW